MVIPAHWLTVLAPAMLFAGSPNNNEPTAPPLEPTKIEDWEAFDRIVNNSGLTLQWIDYDSAPRGHVLAAYENRVLTLQGEQRSASGTGRVTLSGAIVRVSSKEFIFRGNITIAHTPDEGRWCSEDKEWRFAITQNRKYWRLREFEWCDQLTDYIDIYF